MVVPQHMQTEGWCYIDMQFIHMVLLGVAAVFFPFCLGWLGSSLRDRKNIARPCLVMSADLLLAVYALCTLQIRWW